MSQKTGKGDPMTELNLQRDAGVLRLHLLVTVSAVTLANVIGICSATAAEEGGHPTVWIEVGGQLERNDVSHEIFAPPFFQYAEPDDNQAMTGAQQGPNYSLGGEGKVTIAPEGSDWVFSVAAKYGRANTSKHFHHESAGLAPQYFTLGGNPFLQYTPAFRVFGDAQAVSGASHFILDFRAGKDVGLGMFGHGSSSVVSGGVRFAQFASSSHLTLHARPRQQVTTKYNPGAYRVYTIARHTYTATFHAQRDTHAVGPSLSWDGSLPIAGSDNDVAVHLDWGLMGAVLFGRQKVNSDHQVSGRYVKGVASGSLVSNYPTAPQAPMHVHRSRSVVVPNIAGFAAVSFRLPHSKISLGYRGDFYFDAMDVGLNARKNSTIGYYGPFATVSIGLGR